MYKLFYKLRKSPFSLSPDPDFFYLSANHKNALAVLEHSLANWAALSAITGEKGTGKSTLIRYFLKQSWSDVTFGLISESDTPPGVTPSTEEESRHPNVHIRPFFCLTRRQPWCLIDI